MHAYMNILGVVHTIGNVRPKPSLPSLRPRPLNNFRWRRFSDSRRRPKKS